MKVFKTYFTLMKKQSLALALYGIGFIGVFLIITFSIIRTDTDEFSVSKVPMLIINNDEDNEFIKSFMSYLEGYVEYIDVKDDEGARKDAFFYHEVDYILTIPEGFTNNFIKGNDIGLVKETLPDRQDSAQSVDNAINNYINMARTYIKYSSDTTIKELVEFLEKNTFTDTKVSIDSKKKDTLNSSEFNKYYFNYLGYIMIPCFILGVSTVMMSFHGLDIRRRQFASPVSGSNFNLQLILANLVFVFVYLVIFIIMGYLCNPYRKIDLNTVLMWINAFLFSLTVLCISYLIGITVKGKGAVSALSTMISLGLAFISGMFVPQEYLGEAVARVGSFTPSFWYVRANDTISGLTDYSMKNLTPVFWSMAIQIGFAAVFLAVTLVVAKKKRLQTA